MEKILVPVGTKQKLETIFEDLQNYQNINLKRRFDKYVDSYGIEATVKNGVIISNEFKVQQASDKVLTIEAGSAITESFNFLRTLSQTSINLNTTASGLYTIIAQSDLTTDTPAAVVNGFLYQASGGSTTDTREHAGTVFNVSASGTQVNTSGIYLANIDWDGVSTITIYDRRSENVFTFKDSAIPDTNIVKKDRDSTINGNINLNGEFILSLSDSTDTFTFKDESGTILNKFLKTKNYFTQKTGFGGQTDPEHEVDVNGTIRATALIKSDLYTSDDSDNVVIQPHKAGGKVITKLYDDAGEGHFQDKNGTTICYFDKDGFYFNKPVTYGELVTLTNLTITDNTILPPANKVVLSGVKNSTFKVGVGILNGGAGVNVVTEDPDPTTPINFRVYDIKPTENKDEKMSYVHFKWNYHDINGVDNGNSTFLVTGLIEEGGNLDVTNTQIAGKYLYFPETGNKYLIQSWNNTTKVLTLEDYNGEEPTIPEYPAKIIDLASGYELKIKANRKTNADLIDFRRSLTKMEVLDNSYVYNPEFSTKLQLETSHWIQIRSTNNLVKGSFILLPSGTYDPDHTPGGQSLVSYNQPFTNLLPDLTDDGSITVTPTTNGFDIDIGGWLDETDTDKSAHEFEYAYTTLDSLDWTDTTRTTKAITTNRHIPVRVSEARTYQIGVRAIQNKQVVSSIKTTSVVSGGGGIPPNAVKIGSADFDIRRIAGTYEIKGGGSYHSSEEDFYLTDITWSGLCPAPGTLDGKYIDFESGGYDNLKIYSNTGSLTDSYIWLNPGTTTNDIPEGPEKFSIASSKAGRKILKTNLPADFTVTYVHITVDSGRWLSITNPAVLRVYQDGQESAAGTVDITTRNGVVTGTMDVDIKVSQGANRTLIVDLWDPDTTSPNNTASVKGHVDIYGKIILAGSLATIRLT